MRTLSLAAGLLSTALLLAACGEREESRPAPPTPTPETEPATTAQADPAAAFLDRIAQHCSQAFAGRIIADEPPPAGDDPFSGKPLVLHVRKCSEDRIEIPFHVGDDRSRTWVLTRTATGLSLEHDHRHEDGTSDEVTMYGGDTTTPGTARRQEFPVDEHSVEMFEQAGLEASVVNVWAMEIEPGQRFLYELARPGQGRLFQVEFDLTTPVPVPPTPWGHPELDEAQPADAAS